MRLRTVRTRALGAVAVAVLAAATLSACRTNVGVAAVIDGHTVSESDVSSYLTSSSQPVAISQTMSAPPRVFVLDVLILRAFFRKEVEASPVGNVTDRKLAAAHSQLVSGTSDAHVAGEVGAHGYTDAFNKLVVDVSVLAQVRSQLAQNGTLSAIESKLDFPVQLNPRYGTWSKKTLFINSTTSAGTPDFLTLQPTGASGS